VDEARDPREIRLNVPRSIAVVLVVLAIASGHARADGPGSAVASGSSSAAEQSLELIRASAAGPDDAHTEELARQFLVRFARDPLVPRVELELGRVELMRAMNASDEASRAARLDEARRWLDRSLAHADPPTALRARVYLGALAWTRDDDAGAVTILEPIGGSIVDPEDRRLRDTTLFEACEAIGRLDCALDTLDALRGTCRDEAECAEFDARIATLGRSEDAADSALAWVTSSEPTRPSWPALASRAIRLAESRGDWSSIRTIAARAHAANVMLEPEARAIAARAERGAVADPRVIGIIASLSGRNAATGVELIHAIAADAGVPPNDRIENTTFRFVLRDHHGSPEEAARAVSDLVFVSRAIAIIGPMDAASAVRGAERAQQVGVPFLSLVDLPESPFAFDATVGSAPATARDEAERRFGRDLAVVIPRGTSEPQTDERVFFHAGGRIDRATADLLRRSSARAVFVESHSRELPRLVRSLLPLLRRAPRVPRIPIVLSRTGYENLVARGLARDLEGAVVLDLRDAGTTSISAHAARAAFARIRDSRASTRDELASALRSTGRTESTNPNAFVVHQGRLVAMP